MTTKYHIKGVSVISPYSSLGAENQLDRSGRNREDDLHFDKLNFTERKSSVDEGHFAKKSSGSLSKNANYFWDKLDPSQWVPDNKARSCLKCNRDFTWTLRKHHCRKCGRIFCTNCVETREIDSSVNKICVLCSAEYQDYYFKLRQRNVFPKPLSNSADSYALAGHSLLRRGQRLRYSNAESDNGSHSDIKASNVSQLPIYFNLDASLHGAEHEHSRESLHNREKNRSTKRLRFDIEDNVERQNFGSYVQAIKDDELLTSTSSASNQRLKELSQRHIARVVADQLDEFKLDKKKWAPILVPFVIRAAEQVKPSSRMLSDLMDINEYIKIKLVESQDASKCQYVNGVVHSKTLADRRMASNIKHPRIMILRDSLGIKDYDSKMSDRVSLKEGGLMDLASVINQEDHTIKILETKLKQVNPNLIVVENDVSFKIIKLLRDKDIALISNFDLCKLRRLARLTQTILTPSINIIDRAFFLGNCKSFKVETFQKPKAASYSGMHKKSASQIRGNATEQSYIIFDGCNPALGCTIVISGPMDTEAEKEELQTVKTAIKSMLFLARNVVLERAFLSQTQVVVPIFEPKPLEDVPLMSDADFRSIVKDSPFLITKFIANRTTLVYKEIDFLMTHNQQSNYFPFEKEDICDQASNAQYPSAAADKSLLFQEIGELYVPPKNITEQYVYQKTDKICGKPYKQKVTFCLQSSGMGRTDNDETLGRFLKRVAYEARSNCGACSKVRTMHCNEMYHKEGVIQITFNINQSQLQQMQEREKKNTERGPTQSKMGSTRFSQDTGKNNEDRAEMQMYLCCNQCHACSRRALVSSSLFEYSTGRFFEQFFYNKMLRTKKDTFSCTHGTQNGLFQKNDFSIVFEVNSFSKVTFSYKTLDVYSIEIVSPKKFDSGPSQQRYIRRQGDNFVEILDKALQNLKDQIKTLHHFIELTITEFQLGHKMYRETNVSYFRTQLKNLKSVLNVIEKGFHGFIQDAQAEMSKFKDQVFHVQFLKKKTFLNLLSFQRVIDEALKIAALLIVLSRRRVMQIDFYKQDESEEVYGTDNDLEETVTQSEFSRKSLHSLDNQNGEQSSASLNSESYDSEEENDVVPSPNEKKLAEKRATKVLLSISDAEEADDTHIERELTETEVQETDSRLSITSVGNLGSSARRTESTEVRRCHQNFSEQDQSYQSAVEIKPSSPPTFKGQNVRPNLVHTQFPLKSPLMHKTKSLSPSRAVNKEKPTDYSLAPEIHCFIAELCTCEIQAEFQQQQQRLDGRRSSLMASVHNPKNDKGFESTTRDSVALPGSDMSQFVFVPQKTGCVCPISGKASCNKYCINPNHFQDCYDRIESEVSSLIAEIQNAMDNSQKVTPKEFQAQNTDAEISGSDREEQVTSKVANEPPATEDVKFGMHEPMPSFEQGLSAIKKTTTPVASSGIIIQIPQINRWRRIEWIQRMGNYYINLPYGVDNTFVQINPEDPGSIISFALSSNIYLEGLAKINYMNLQTHIKKHAVDLADKPSGSIPNQVLLLEKENVLNYDPVDPILIESEMLGSNKLSFSFKFSNYVKNVFLHIEQGRNDFDIATSTIHFKTGHYDKPQDENTASSQRSKGLPRKRQKRRINDLQLQVMPNVPKEYLKNEIVRECLTELESIHSSLSSYYFTKAQTEAFQKYRVPAPEFPSKSPDIRRINLDSFALFDVKLDKEFSPKETSVPDSLINTLFADQSLQHQMASFASSRNFVNSKITVKTNNRRSKNMYAQFQNSLTSLAGLKDRERGDPKDGSPLLPQKLILEQATIFGITSPAKHYQKELSHQQSTLNEHLKIPRVDFEVKVFFPKRFSATRRFFCGTHKDFLQSLFKTTPWSTTGGRTSAKFFLTHDQKYVFKEVKESEFKMFIEFGPTYFDYLCKAFFHKFPCALAKILGAFVLKIDSVEKPKLSSERYLFVMENLNLGIAPEEEQHIVRYDLKGSEANRLITLPPDSTRNVVFQDTNFLWNMNGRPLTIRLKLAQLLYICVNNDSLCLSKQNIIDYSLLVIIDTKRKKVRFGIIDYLQVYTIERQIESKAKKVARLGLDPTIVGPKKYRDRFKTFIMHYIVGLCVQNETRRCREAQVSELRSLEKDDEEIIEICQPLQL